MTQYTVIFYPVIGNCDSDLETEEVDGVDEIEDEHVCEEGASHSSAHVRVKVCELCGWTMRATEKRCPQCAGEQMNERVYADRPVAVVIKVCEHCGWIIAGGNVTCPRCRHER